MTTPRATNTDAPGRAVPIFRDARRYARLVLGQASAVAAILGFLLPGAALAGHSIGHTHWVNKGCSGCHGDPPAAPRHNAADAPQVITAAMNNNAATGMGFLLGSVSVAERGEIAAYLETEFNTATINRNVTFQTATPHSLAAFITPGTAATGLALATVSSPGKGSVGYAGSTFTYTPGACQVGADSFSYRGVNGGLFTSTRTVNITIGNPTSGPTINSAAAPGGQTGVAYSHSVTVNACPSLVTYSVSAGALPTGLTLDPASGSLSGTPTALGNFTGTIRATYTGGQFGSQAFNITISPGPPVVTSAATAPNGSMGVAYAGYAITATNSPTTFGATGLPPGLVVNPATGAITGTPTDASGSPYNATVTASNGVPPDGSRAVIFNVVPAINSAATASGQTGVAFSYQITKTAGPAFTGYAALDPLPAGLTLNATSGLISGTPAAVGGPTNVRLTGSNAFGTSAPFTLAITVTLGPPAITSPLAASGGATVPFSYQITASNPPHTSFNATPLPAGLTVDTATGLISGTPAPGTGGVHLVTISATNATGPGQATLTLTISESAPVITSPGTASGTTGAPFSYQITASNGVTTYGATGLPPGLSLNASSGLISGTPTAPGTFNATMTATNGSGSDTDPLVITIALGPPVITSASTAGGAEGVPFSYQITATNSPTSFGATGLPSGLTVNAATGLISGTATVSGTFNVTISATNATATATQGLTITLGVGVPVITSAATASGGTGSPFLYQVIATNNPTSYGATGLPQGLSINTSTGLITGAPASAGTFTANLSATNPSGTGSRVLTINVTQLPPTVVTGTPVIGQAGVPLIHRIEPGNGATGFSATGLPPGLSLDTGSGIVSGTPTSGGTFTATVSVVNSAGTTTFALTFVIAFPLPTVADATASVPFETATAIALPVSGQNATIGIVSLPSHGLVSVQGFVATYTPAVGYVGADAFTYAATNSAGTSAPATVRITVVPIPPTGGDATMTVQLNTRTTMSLAPFVKGAGLSGVAVRATPRHGTVSVNGLAVTYSPRTDFFGGDTFTYVVFGSLGVSQPATVRVEVVGRPDPTRDPDVTGLIEAQNQAARRFASTQVANFQRRMEALHHPERVPITDGDEPAAAPPPAASTPASEPVRLAAAPAPAATATDARPLNLAATMAQLVTTGTLPVQGASPVRAGTTLWIGGAINFGTIDGSDSRGATRFDTDGVSFGVDRQFTERFAGGVGAGFARDESKVGTNGTRSKARGASVAGYGTWQMGPRTYIDALLGYGALRFDSQRYVTAIEDFAGARRDGSQVFGAVTGGYEWLRGNLLVAPYGRAEFSVDRLDSASESGVGAYALRFAEQTQKSAQGALGVRVESRHEIDGGWAMPRARVEYRREFGGDRRAALAYADLIGGPEYSTTPAGTSRNSLLFGVGADLQFRGGLRFGLDYTAQRSSGAANVQGIRIFVSQDLDAPRVEAWVREPVLFLSPVNVDWGYGYDDNVNRGRLDNEKRWDNVVSMSANQSWSWIFRENFRAQATWLASGEKFDRNAGLGRFSVGGQGELQYRTSGAFDATTFAVLGRAQYEQYESYYRTGPRYSVALNARRALTDRIEAFGEVGYNVRNGRSDVFRWRDYAAKVNLDYALGRKGTLYLTGEYRRGDAVSSGFPSLANVGVAEVFVPDDAFNGELIAYRFDARTLIGTLGVNYPLGARDSVDLSWRRVESTAIKRPSFDFAGSLKYIDNQYNLVYLMRF